MKLYVVYGEHLSVSRGVYKFIFWFIYYLVKNAIIFVADFIVDVGRVIFGRGCTNLGFFHVQLFD